LRYPESGDKSEGYMSGHKKGGVSISSL